jgi:hypothetical protein
VAIAREIRDAATQSLRREGFALNSSFASEFYTPDTGDILRYYAPHFAIRHNGVSIQGLIGLVLVNFEQSWAQNHTANHDYLPFGMLIDNCRDLVNVPIFRSIEHVDEWIAAISGEVRKLPGNREALTQSVRENRLGPYPINFFFLPNDKSKAAIKWALAAGSRSELR